MKLTDRVFRIDLWRGHAARRRYSMNQTSQTIEAIFFAALELEGRAERDQGQGACGAHEDGAAADGCFLY